MDHPHDHSLCVFFKHQTMQHIYFPLYRLAEMEYFPKNHHLCFYLKKVSNLHQGWCEWVYESFQKKIQDFATLLLAGSHMWCCQWFCVCWRRLWWHSSCFHVLCWLLMMAFALWLSTLTVTTAKCSSTWRWFNVPWWDLQWVKWYWM